MAFCFNHVLLLPFAGLFSRLWHFLVIHIYILYFDQAYQGLTVGFRFASSFSWLYCETFILSISFLYLYVYVLEDDTLISKGSFM